MVIEAYEILLRMWNCKLGAVAGQNSLNTTRPIYGLIKKSLLNTESTKHRNGASIGCQKVQKLSASGPPDPLTRGSAPGPRWGHGPQTPVIGSRYRARHVPEPSHFSLRSDVYDCYLTATYRYQLHNVFQLCKIKGISVTSIALATINWLLL